MNFKWAINIIGFQWISFTIIHGKREHDCFLSKNCLEAKIDSPPIIPLLLQYHRWSHLIWWFFVQTKIKNHFSASNHIKHKRSIKRYWKFIIQQIIFKRTTKDKHICQNHETTNNISFDFQQNCSRWQWRWWWRLRRKESL